MRVNENEGVTFDETTSELKINKDYYTFTQRTFLKISFAPSLEDYPFDVHNLSIKFDITSKTVALDVEDKTSNEPPQDIGGSTEPKQLTAEDVERSVTLALREVLPNALPIKNRQPGRVCIFRFNMHKNPDNDVMIRFKDPNPVKDKICCLPDLRIAYGEVSWKTLTERKGHDEVYSPALKVKYPLFRDPERVLFIKCGPLLVINILSLCGYILEKSDFSPRMAVAVVNSLALVAHLPTCMKEKPTRTVTSVDLTILQTVIVMILFFADSMAGAHGNNGESFVHTLFPIVSGLLIFLMNMYLLARYTLFLTSRSKLLEFHRFGGVKKTSVEFDNSNWKTKDLRLSDNCEEIRPEN